MFEREIVAWVRLVNIGNMQEPSVIFILCDSKVKTSLPRVTQMLIAFVDEGRGLS